MLRQLRLEVSLEGIAITPLKVEGCSDIQVVQEVSDMEEHRVTSLANVNFNIVEETRYADLCYTKELDGGLAAIECAFFSINLLKTHTVILRVKVIKTRSSPVLILFCIVLLQAIDVLCQFFEYFFFKLTLRLSTRSAIPLTLQRSGGLFRGWQELAFLGGRLYVATRSGHVLQDSLARHAGRLLDQGRHTAGTLQELYTRAAVR